MRHWLVQNTDPRHDSNRRTHRQMGGSSPPICKDMACTGGAGMSFTLFFSSYFLFSPHSEAQRPNPNAWISQYTPCYDLSYGPFYFSFSSRDFSYLFSHDSFLVTHS